MDKIILAEYSPEYLKKLYDEKVNKNDYLGAISVLDRIVQNSHADRQTYKCYAQIYYKMGIYTKSIKYWFLCLSHSSEKFCAYAYNGLGACFYNLGYLDVAGYYFQEQLKINKNYLEYNEVASKYYDEITDNSNDYYIAYPPEKADYSNLIQKARDLIVCEEYQKAIDELSIVPKKSKYYQEALTQIAVCEFLLDRTESLIHIKEAVLLNENNIVPLCNAITMYNKSKNRYEVDEFLTKLLKIDFENNIEDLYKVIILFTEIKAYDKIEKYSKIYLSKNPYDLNVLFIIGINSYNLNKFDDALRYFKKGYRISKDYVFKYYLKVSENAINRSEKGVKTRKYDYNISLPQSENENVLNYLYSFIDKEYIPKKSLLKVQEYVNYCLVMNSYKLQSYATVVIFKYPNKLRNLTLKECLLSTNLYDGIKAGIICYLIGDGYEGELSIVVGNIYKKRIIYQPNFAHKNEVFLTAYSLCVSKVLPIHEDLLVIKETAEKIVKVLSREIMLNGEYKDARSLSAVFYEYSGLNNIKSRREFLNHFDANQQEVKKIESVLSLNGIEK